MNGTEWALVVLVFVFVVVSVIALAMLLSGMTPTTGIGS